MKKIMLLILVLFLSACVEVQPGEEVPTRVPVTVEEDNIAIDVLTSPAYYWYPGNIYGLLYSRTGITSGLGFNDW